MSLNTLMELHHEGSSAWRSFNLESIQFSIELESPVITPGTLPFVLHSALSSGPVFDDLWWGDRWISSTAMELDGVRVEGQLEVPDYLPDGAIVWMRAYRSAYLPGQGVRHPIGASRRLASRRTGSCSPAHRQWLWSRNCHSTYR